MTTIAASCPICGDVEVMGEDVTVIEHSAGLGTYTFACPLGKHGVTKDAGPEVIRLLRAARGITWVTLPAEALEPKAGPPINLDDLIDLVREMEKL